MPFPFQKIVLTGACGGLGQALARRFIAQGAQLALAGLNRQALQELAELAPQRTAIYTPDVSDQTAMQAVANDWLARFGLPDLVIANAGVAGGFDPARAEDLPVLRRFLEVNLLGVAATFQPFIAPLRDSGQRSALVGIASIAGWRGMPGNAAYCASKAGVIRYLESLRAELRESRIRVHTVSPGYIRTALTAANPFPMPGLLEADEAARQLLAGIAAGREHIVLPRRTGWLARALGLLPSRLHDRVLLAQPRKLRPGAPGATPVPGLARLGNAADPASQSPPKGHDEVRRLRDAIMNTLPDTPGPPPSSRPLRHDRK